jgi:hypothetical protein
VTAPLCLCRGCGDLVALSGASLVCARCELSLSGSGQSEDRKTPMLVAGQQGAAAVGDRVQFVTSPMGVNHEPAGLGGPALFRAGEPEGRAA